MSTLLIPSEVDRLLRYPRGRAVRLAKSGRLPAVFLPDGEIRFDPETIRTLMQPQANAPEVANG